MPRARMTAKRIAWALAGVLGLLLLVLAFLQTGPGLTALERSLEAMMSSPGQLVEIDGLDGRVPDRLKIDQITISDTAGTWLSAREISLTWRPLRLLGGLLHVEQLTAADISLVRLPESDQAPSKEASAELAMPQSPFALRVDLLNIEAIDLQPAVIGTPAGLRLTGSLSTETEETIQTALEVERIDGLSGSISVKSAYVLTKQTLDIDAQIHEPADGLVARLLGIAGLPEVSLSLTGSGPVTDWHGRLAAKSGEVTNLDTDITIAAGDTVEFTVGGSAAVKAFAPAAYRDLLTPPVTFSTNGAWDHSANIVRINKARFANEAFDIGVAGRFSVKTMHIDASASMSLDGARFAALTVPLTAERIDLELNLTGPPANLAAQFSANARKLALDPVSMYDISVIGTVSTKKADATNGSVLGVVATIKTNGFATGVPATAGLLGARPRAFVAGDFNLAKGLFNASDVRLTGGAMNLLAKGITSLDGTTMDLSLETTIDDLSRLPVGSSVALKGNGRVTTEIKAQGGAITATIRGRAARFNTGVGALDSLVGEQFEFVASVAGAPDSPWQVSDLALDAKNISIRGDLKVSGEFDTIDANYTATLPDLVPLASALGTDMSGHIDSAGSVAGKLDNLSFTGGVDAIGLSVAGQFIPRVSLLLEVQNLTSEPQGSFATHAEYSGAPATVRGEFALSDAALRLSSVEIDGPGLRAVGDLAVPTDGGAINGTIRADAFDLKSLSAVFDQSVSGRATANIELGETGGAPTLQTKLNASELILELNGKRFSATSATAEAELAYGSEDQDFTSALNVSGMTAPLGTLTSLSVTAEGSAQDIRYRADAKGDIRGETDLSLEGTLTRPAGKMVVALTKLIGQLAGQTIALATPTRAQITESGFALDPVQLNLAGGEVRAQGAVNDTAVTADIVFKGLPTTLQAIAGLDLPISGTLDGELRLQGAPERPEATLSVAGRRLQFQPDKQSPPGPVELSLAGSLRDDLLAFELVGADGDFFSLTSKGQAPLRFAVKPFTLMLTPDGEVSGELDFAGNAAVIEKMVPIDPHRIRGNLHARASIAGTVAKPIVTGTATLAEGRYENIEIGTVLEKVEATIKFLEGRANVRATAQDGTAGRIDLNGHAELAQPRSLDLILRMDNVTLVRRDELVAALSGDIFASGEFGDLLVSGQVETNTIEVRLIDSLPPEIVSLDVEEVGLGRFRAPALARKTEDAFAARLEIGVTIPKQLFVRGRGLDSEWQGDLRVFGTTADAEVTGQLSAVRGQFSFAGKTFKLAKGVIDIDERDGEFVALLDVQTEFTGDDFIAKVNVTGPATKPEIGLTSTPELPRDEVLARILFGRGTGQLSPIEAFQLAEAVATLSGVEGSSTGLLDKVRSTLGVDVLQVDGGDGDAGPSVRAGKYVADGVFVGAKQGAGPGASAATVEIELTPNISLESEVGQTGRSRAGVNWQFNY